MSVFVVVRACLARFLFPGFCWGLFVSLCKMGELPWSNFVHKSNTGYVGNGGADDVFADRTVGGYGCGAGIGFLTGLVF